MIDYLALYNVVFGMDGKYEASSTVPLFVLFLSAGREVMPAASTSYVFTTPYIPLGVDIAGGINNLGQATGSFYTSDPVLKSYSYHGFLDVKGAITQFDVPGGFDTFANGINDAGQIVGYNFSPDHAHFYTGFLKDGGQFTTIIAPGGVYTFPEAINNAGQIVGSYMDSFSYTHGFLDSNGSFTKLDFPGFTNTHAYGINNLGQVVGTYNCERPCATFCIARGLMLKS